MQPKQEDEWPQGTIIGNCLVCHFGNFSMQMMQVSTVGEAFAKESIIASPSAQADVEPRGGAFSV